jgi:hypothetical protein
MMNIKNSILFFMICMVSQHLFCMNWPHSGLGWLTANMTIGSSDGKKSTQIYLKSESALIKKSSYDYSIGADDLVYELFGLRRAQGVTTKPGEDIFKYDSKGSYNNLIDKITDAKTKIIARNALRDFQNYVNNNIDSVCSSGSNFNVVINTEKNNVYTAAAKDLYRQARQLGEKVGVSLPNLDDTWTQAFWKKFVPFALVGGGLYLTYRYRAQIPTLGDVGCSLSSTGIKLKEIDTRLRAPTPKPVAAPSIPVSSGSLSAPAAGI